MTTTAGLLKHCGVAHIVEQAMVRVRHTYLANSVAHHEQCAVHAAHRGDFYAWLDHLEYQAHYLTAKVALHRDSLERNTDDREALCFLLEKIRAIEPRLGPSATCFNVKLQKLQATYGPLARPQERAYGIGIARA